MIGKFHDQTFDLSQHSYEEFYESHQFVPMSDQDAFSVHEVIPRFGWGFDVIQELAEGKDELRVLDLGCLDGSFLLTVADRLPNVYGTGIDLTKDGIQLARQRAHDHKLELTFLQGKVEDHLRDLHRENQKFDVVTWFEIIEHVDDPSEVQKLIDRVLAPGGSVLVSTPSFESPYFGADDEQNKCHVRLYTTKDEDYEAVNKYGTLRQATSMPKFLKDYDIVEMEVMSELINCRYKEK